MFFYLETEVQVFHSLEILHDVLTFIRGFCGARTPFLVVQRVMVSNWFQLKQVEYLTKNDKFL